MHSLRINYIVVSAVVIAGSAAAVEPPKKAAAPVVPPTKELLDKLLKAYKLYELPFPPEDAPLVRTATGTQTYDNGKFTDTEGLGFLIKAKNAGQPDRVYWRPGQIDGIPRRQVVTIVEPRPESVMAEDWNVHVELAVVCHALGWTDLALKVLELDPSGKQQSPETDLARSAWHYWLAEFRKSETDRAKVARLLTAIWEHRRDDFSVHDRNMLDALNLSLLPGKGKPGTIEAMIDDLVDVTRTDQSEFGIRADKSHPAYVRLARRGFEAIPALLEHLDDVRLSRDYKEGFNNFRGYHYTVADVVCDLLQGLAGADIGKDWLRRQQGYRLEKADVEKWWAEARKVGEEAYFVDHVLRVAENNRWPNQLMLEVLVHKYPNRLPEVYRRLVDDRPEMYTSPVARAVAASSLPKETKRELFLRTTQAKNLDHRLDAIDHLRELDPEEALKALLAGLKVLPGIPDPEKSHYANEFRFARLVIKMNHPQAWAALEETARGSQIRSRAEIVRQMVYAGEPMSPDQNA